PAAAVRRCGHGAAPRPGPAWAHRPGPGRGPAAPPARTGPRSAPRRVGAPHRAVPRPAAGPRDARSSAGPISRSTGCTAEVAAVTGVDLDLVAGVDEQRHLDLRAGLQLGRLGATGRTVALQARV